MSKYTVLECINDLDGHELDREIKIKLANGEIRKIDGMQFINACIGGDDVIYIVEDNELYNELKTHIGYIEQIVKTCNVVINKSKHIDEDWTRETLIVLAREIDFWLDEFNIKHNYGPLTGPGNEIVYKIEILKKYLNKRCYNE